MTLQFTILGCGSSGGVPRPALGWGVCDPNNPKNRRRRTSFLAERRVTRRRHPRAGRHLAGSARAAPRRQRRLGRRGAVHARACRPHPRHRRPARAVHQPPQTRAGLARRTRLAAHARPLRLLLHVRARQRISADGARTSDGAVPDHHGRGAGRYDHRPAHPPGAWRHPIARLPVRPLGLFLRPQRPAGRQRDGAGRPQGLDHRCAARQRRIRAI